MKKEEVNDFSEMDDSFLQGLKKNPFLVPDNYFDTLYHQTISEKNISDLKDKESFGTPHLYFDNLEEQILAQTKISNNNSFSLPEDYFNKLSDNILSRTSSDSIPNARTRVFKISFIKYAAAAVILLATTFGIYNNYYKSDKNISISEKLAEIPDQEILDYLSSYSDTNDIILILEDIDDFATIEESISHL